MNFKLTLSKPGQKQTIFTITEMLNGTAGEIIAREYPGYEVTNVEII